MTSCTSFSSSSVSVSGFLSSTALSFADLLKAGSVVNGLGCGMHTLRPKAPNLRRTKPKVEVRNLAMALMRLADRDLLLLPRVAKGCKEVGEYGSLGPPPPP